MQVTEHSTVLHDTPAPALSIIVPVYNMLSYLPRALESCLAQSVNAEVIVVDNGSTDGSGQVCDEYAECYPEQFQVIHQDHAGVAVARNRGLAEARGEYVVFLDSDDYLEPLAGLRLYNRACAVGADVCKGRCVQCAAKGNSSATTVFQCCFHTEHGLIPRNPLFFIGDFWSAIYKRSYLLERCLFFRDVALCEDLLWLNEVMLYRPRIALIEDVVYNYCLRDDSSSRGSHSKSHKAIEAALETMLTIVLRLKRFQSYIDPSVIGYIYADLIYRMQVILPYLAASSADGKRAYAQGLVLIATCPPASRAMLVRHLKRLKN